MKQKSNEKHAHTFNNQHYMIVKVRELLNLHLWLPIGTLNALNQSHNTLNNLQIRLNLSERIAQIHSY